MSFFGRFVRLFASRRLDRDLDDELRSHIEMRTAENISAGMSAEEAHLDALRRFGNTTLIHEQARSARLPVLLETVVQDVRYGLRTLRKSPAFAIVAIMSLALGIGINAAVFSLINTLLFREVNLTDPASVVSLYRLSQQGALRANFPFAAIESLQKENHVFSGMAAWLETTQGIRVNGAPAENVRAGFYSGNYYSLLGVQPYLGREFNSEDNQPGQPPVAMISYSYWQRRFSGSAAALESTIQVKGTLFKIVGVTPPSYSGLTVLSRPPDIALPLVWYPQFKLNDDDVSADIVARLKPGTTIAEASAEITVLFRRIPPDSLGAGWTHQVQHGLLNDSIEVHSRGKGDEWGWEDYKLRLTILMGVVGFVLLIACANVANLLLARGTARRREIAIRLAIGAARMRVVRQLMTESLLVAVTGGAIGLGLAVFANRVLAQMLGIRGNFALDWRVLGFALGASLVAGILFGLAPALRSTRVDLQSGLKETGGQNRVSDRKFGVGLGKALVVLQIALSLTLVAGTGLLLQTLRNLTGVDPGFDRENVLLFWIYPTTAGYQGDSEIRLYDDYLRRFNAVPGVVHASMARHYLMQGAANFGKVSMATPGSADKGTTFAAINAVAPGFFETMRVPLVAGRDFSANDTPDSMKVAIVDRRFALDHFGDENPLGRHILLDNGHRGLEMEIVGVVRDIHYYSMRQEASVPSEELFLPFTQAPPEMLGQMCFAVRTASNPMDVFASLRREAQAVDKNLFVGFASTQAEIVEESTGQEHSLVALTGSFSVLALSLACIGLYGVMAYTVSRRTNEIGIRMALGADRFRVRVMVLRESAIVILAGLGIGAPVAIATSSYLRSILYGIRAFDITTFVASGILLAAVACLATYLPARRASLVEPVVALRQE